MAKQGRAARIDGARYGHSCQLFRSLFFVSLVPALGVVGALTQIEHSTPGESLLAGPGVAFVVTQLPAGTALEKQGTAAGPSKQGLRADFGEGARLVMVNLPDTSIRILSRDFHSACDPEISFDGSRILFAAKKRVTDDWNIFEMGADGSNIRQITNDLGDCRSPGYQATLFVLAAPEPWYQLTFVRSEKGTLNEYGVRVPTSLYSCKLDGSAVRRLTFNLSSDMDPAIMPDGRLLFASWQRARLDHGPRGRIGLFGINIDGTDYAAFSTEEGKPIKYMPCVTTRGLAVFVEADPANCRIPWDGAGNLACVTLRRPLHSYRPITSPDEGLFHSPSPLPDGRILVSRRSTAGTDTHGVYVLDPQAGQFKLIFDDPNYHDIQAKAIYVRGEPDGRSGVVSEEEPNGKLYCLNVYISDLEKPEWLSPGTVKRLRVLEGLPLAENTSQDGVEPSSPSPAGIPSLAQRRVLGEINLEEDGSFNIEIPANTPIELQTLDADGMALRSCGWIWAKNYEPRGCIGCHEDGELTPENIFVKALTHPSIKLTLPPERRRTVDFRRDVMPILTAKCARCHDKADSTVQLGDGPGSAHGSDGNVLFNPSYESLLADGSQPGLGKYVHPGKARTSPLIWQLFGRNTSRPWDKTSPQRISPMPPAGSVPLSEDERRTFVEWIDMGALWDGIPGPDGLLKHDKYVGGTEK